MLDRLVNRMLMDLRLIERALHGDGAWTATWAGMTVPLEIHAQDDSLSFEAEFKDFCLLNMPRAEVEICVDGEPVAWRDITHPGDGGFTFKWTLRLDAERVAA